MRDLTLAHDCQRYRLTDCVWAHSILIPTTFEVPSDTVAPSPWRRTCVQGMRSLIVLKYGASGILISLCHHQEMFNIWPLGIVFQTYTQMYIVTKLPNNMHAYNMNYNQRMQHIFSEQLRCRTLTQRQLRNYISSSYSYVKHYVISESAIRCTENHSFKR